MNEQAQRLIDAYLDRTITADEIGTFQEMLLADREVRDRFRSLAVIDSFLSEQAQGQVRELRQWFGAPELVVAAAHPRWPRRGLPSRIGLTATALAILCSVMLWSSLQRSGPLPVDAVELPATFATIASVEGAALDASGQSLPPGKRLAEQVLRLARGSIQLEFDSGAMITLVDRAELHLKSAASATLISGRLLFRNDRPNSTFDLRTPLSELVDLGTSYGVSLRDDFEEVHVFDGEVWRTSQEDPEATVLMDAGYARRFGHDLPPFGEEIPLDHTAAPPVAAPPSVAASGKFQRQVIEDFAQYGEGPVPAGAVLGGGRGWAEPWRWHSRDSWGSLISDRALTIRDGMIVESGNTFLNRKLAEPIRLDRDGTVYFRVCFRLEVESRGKNSTLFVILRGSEELAGDVPTDRLVTLVGWPKGQVVTRLAGLSELQRITLDARRNYQLVGRIDARRFEPDRFAVAVLPADDPAWRSEPIQWANLARPVESHGVLDLFAMHVNSEEAVSLGEVRLAPSWSELVGE